MMRRIQVLLVSAVALGAFAGLSSALQADVIGVELNVVPGPETNRLDMTLTATISGGDLNDSDTATVSGALAADLEVYFEPATHHVADVNAIEFTGGRIYFSDVSFALDFGIFGRINATGTGISAMPTSPLGPGIVEGGYFNTVDHVLVVDQGYFSASGTGVIGGFFDPITVDLAAEPMEISSEATGTISVSLEGVEGNEGTYSVSLNLPLDYDVLLFENELITISFQGSGLVEGIGSFTRRICTLRSDLAGGNCRVDAAALAVFCDQWLAYSDLAVCPLSADLYGDDCYVDLADFAVLAGDWLQDSAQ
jgi:hypothetical protein